MVALASCPDIHRYTKLVTGHLLPADRDALLNHLEGCDACVERVESLSDQDTLVDLIRQARTVSDVSTGDTFARLVERLRTLRPGGGAVEKAPEHILLSCAPVVDNSPAGSNSGVGTIDSPGGFGQNLWHFLARAQSPDELGRLGPYRVLKVLGAGGMGVVFLAEDPHLERVVALKAMLPELAASESARQRFVREARAAAKLKHDHIVTIHQVGEERGAPYLAMEFLEGQSLDDCLKHAGKLPTAEVLRIGREMAEGLAAAHQHGLIHRDIKPANVWLEGKRGRVKILDFGLARAAAGESPLTQTGAIVGTPAYMAPEQAQGKNLDHRCDLFSLGCVLYRMTTGEKPFKGTDMISTLMAVSTYDPPPPVSLNLDLPTELSVFIMQLLAKDPAERPRSAHGVVETLERMAQEDRSPTPVKAAPREEKSKVSMLARRGRRIAVAVAAAALLLPLILWLSGIIIRVESKDGTLVIKTDDPTVAVKVTSEGGATVTYGKDRREIHLKPGKYGIELAEAKEGLKLSTTHFTISSGDNRTIEVRWEKKESASQATKGGDPKPKIVPPTPSAALNALRRDHIAPEALAVAGDGDPKKAPANLVAVLGKADPVHNGSVFKVAFSADGRWLASGSGDSTIQLRDVATGRVQRVLKGHTGPVTSVAFSRDSRILVSASHDGSLRLWSMDRETQPRTLPANLGAIWGMAVSADGRFVAAVGSLGGVHLWKWGQWDAPVEIIPQNERGWSKLPYPVACLDLSSDGELLAVGLSEDRPDKPSIRIYRTTDGKVIRTIMGDGEKRRSPVDITFSRDGKHLACHFPGAKVGVWEVASGNRMGDLPANHQYGSVALTPDGKQIAVGMCYRFALHDLASSTSEHVVYSGQGVVFSEAFSPDGKLFAAGFQFGIVRVWDTTTWKEKYLEHGHLQHVRALAFSPDGTRVISTGNDGTLRQWDLARPGTNQIVHSFLADDHYAGAEPPGFAPVSYSPDGKVFASLVRGVGYYSFRDEMALNVWDAATLKQRWAVPLYLNSVAISADGKTIAGACQDGTVRLWGTDFGTELHRFPSIGQCAGIAFSGDGKLLAAATWDKDCLKVWNVASGAEVQSWQDASMTAVAFRADGQLIATGHKDGTISIWDLPAGTKKRTLKGHPAQVQSLRFTPDGKSLVSSGHDGTIRVWNPEFERAQQVIAVGPTNQRLVMDLDRSGEYLVAAGHGPMIYVLRLATGGPQRP